MYGVEKEMQNQDMRLFMMKNKGVIVLDGKNTYDH